MTGGKKKQRRKVQSRSNSNPFPTINKFNRSSRITTKNLEVFVTDFLIDPCGLPVELRDYVLVDGTISSNDITSCNNSQVLKNIFDNNESIERTIKNTATFIVEDSLKKVNEMEHGINV